VILDLALRPPVDVTNVVGRMNEGIQVRPLEVHRVVVGKTINAARVASKLGDSVRVVAPLDGFTGQFVASELRREKISLCAIDAISLGTQRATPARAAR
jgi:fructose-1-phosphate kinase PfkB-like protein